MFDMVYTDNEHKDIGVIQAYGLDAAWGADENDFELVMPAPRKERRGVDREAVISDLSGLGSVTIDSANGSQLAGLGVGGVAERKASRNILKPGVGATSNGITFNVNSDGSVTASGSTTDATTTATLAWRGYYEAGTYAISGCPVGGSGTTYYIRAYDFNAGRTLATDYANGSASFTIDSAREIDVIIGVYGQQDFNKTFYPQVEVGDTATSYVPYGHSVDVVHGKNLLDVSKNESVYPNPSSGGIATLADGISYVVPCAPSTTYTVSRVTVGAYPRFTVGETSAYPSAGTTCTAMHSVGASNTSYTFTTNASTNYLAIFFDRYTTHTQGTGYQLERGSVATPYVPYGALEVVTSGKNLLPTLDALASGSVRYVPVRIGVGKSATLSTTCEYYSGSANMFLLSGNVTSGISTSANGARIGYPRTMPAGADGYVTVAYRIQSTSDTQKPWEHDNQIEVGTQATEYEPYTETRTTLDVQGNVLASLPDGTKDELTVDASGHVQLVKRVGVVTLNGSENDWHTDSTNKGFTLNTGAPKPSNGSANTPNAFTASYETGNLSKARSTSGVFSIWAATSDAQVLFNKGSFTTVDEFTNWLSSNNQTICYELAEPKTIDLGTIELPYTLDGYTRFTLDASMDAPLTVRYVVQKATKSYEVDAVPSIDFGALVYIDGTQLGGVVDDKSPDATSDVQTVTYHGRTWHGIMADSVLSPDAGKDYLTYSGDANGVIRTIIARQGLGDIFTCDGDAGISVSGRFDRYTDMYSGLMKMLSRDASRRGRLSIYKEPGGKVHVEAVPVSEYTSEVDSDRYGFKSTVDARPYNHLICLGEGDLKDRDVVHLYADENGNVSTTQTLFGIDERTITYDYSNAEHDELVSKGTERLLELQRTSGVSMSVASDTGTFEVGDVVGAYDNLTGIYAESYVNKVIVNVGESGFATYSYEVGEIGTVGKSSAGGGVSMSTLQAGYVKKSGDTMTGALVISDSHNLVVQTDIKTSETPSADMWNRGLFITETDGKNFGYVRSFKKTNGYQGVQLEATRNVNGTAVYNGVQLATDANGNRTVYLSDTAAWHDGLGMYGSGSFVSLQGIAQSASDELVLTTSYQNVLAGKCKAVSANGHAGYPWSDEFEYSTADGTITLKRGGVYLVMAQIYMYRNFTANDQVNWTIGYNGSRQSNYFQQVKAYVANPYTMHSMTLADNWYPGTKLSIMACNANGARGSIQRYDSTYITVVRL